MASVNPCGFGMAFYQLFIILCLLQSVQKETQPFKRHFMGIEMTDCIKNDISVALPFNKEPERQSFVADWTSHSDFGTKN